MTRSFRSAGLAFALALGVSACGGKELAPSGLTYQVTTAVYTAGTAITPNEPRASGGPAKWYGISPALPAGLTLSETSGVISGTPTALSPATLYLVTASNGGGSATTSLLMTVNRPAAPVIVTQPITQVVALDQTATFSVAATGSGALTYQWFVDDVAVPGATGTTITSAPMTALVDNLKYTVEVSDRWGSTTTSAYAKLRLEGFVATGLMQAARQNHGATRLGSGKVLVTGGDGASAAPLTSAELYDPALGTFAFTGDMLAARQSHTSVLLGTGKVLLIGGQGGVGGGTALSTTELYDPVAGSFSASGPMSTPRFFHTSTVLQNGQVLVTGGLFQSTGGAPPVETAEVYAPSTGTFTATGPMNHARYRHTATLLASGQVLITGGYGLGFALGSAELYDPAFGTFTVISAPMNAARYSHTATRLADDTVLLAGGQGAGTLASAELFNPADSTFQTTGTLNFARAGQTATLLPSGRVLLAGPAGPSCSPARSSTTRWGPSRSPPCRWSLPAGTTPPPCSTPARCWSWAAGRWATSAWTSRSSSPGLRRAEKRPREARARPGGPGNPPPDRRGDLPHRPARRDRLDAQLHRPPPSRAAPGDARTRRHQRRRAGPAGRATAPAWRGGGDRPDAAAHAGQSGEALRRDPGAAGAAAHRCVRAAERSRGGSAGAAGASTRSAASGPAAAGRSIG
jgi:hypothetical protein